MRFCCCFFFAVVVSFFVGDVFACGIVAEEGKCFGVVTVFIFLLFVYLEA